MEHHDEPEGGDGKLFFHERARHARSRGHPVWVLIAMAVRILFVITIKIGNPKIRSYCFR